VGLWRDPCLFGDGSGSIDIDTSLQVSVGISTVAKDSIIPPKVSQFGITFVCNTVFARLGHPKTMIDIIDHVDNLCVGLDANANAKFSVSGDISGQISSATSCSSQSVF
jgi:hypothetical protein